MVTELPDPGVTARMVWAHELNEAIQSRYEDSLQQIGTEANARAASVLAFPREQPATVALLGESITNTAYQGAGVGIYDAPSNPAYAHSQGYWTWANIALGQRMRLVYTGGVAGNTTAMLLARVTDITELPVLPGFCVVQACINDILLDVPVADVISNLIGIWTALRAKGITVVACTALPVWTAVSARRKRQEDINNFIRDYANTQPGMILCDWAGIWTNASDGAPKTGYHNGDGVHPSIVGAAAIGEVLADALRPHLPGGPLALASNNVDGSATVNPMMLGTAGIAAAGTTGDLADGWIGARFSGAGTLDFDKIPRTDGIGGEWQRVAVAGGGGNFIIYQDFSSSLPTPGEKWIAELEFNAAVLSGMNRFTLQIIASGPGTPQGYSPFSGDTMPFPANITEGVLQTAPIEIPVGVTSIQTAIAIVATSGTVDVSRIRSRKVAA